MSKGKVIKHQQINFNGKLSLNTEHIQYVQRCKPYGNEQLSKSQLKIKLHDTDKIYVNLGVELCNLYYGIVDSILSGRSLTKDQLLGIELSSSKSLETTMNVLSDIIEKEK